jgi:hypothetical protein
MPKFDDFMNSKPKEVEDLKELQGTYGCQVCKEDTTTAYFNEKTMEIVWFCSEKHRSTIQLG